jgi:hypothetical protein
MKDNQEILKRYVMIACKTLGFVCLANGGLAFLLGLIFIVFYSNENKAWTMAAICIGMSTLSIGMGLMLNKIMAPFMCGRIQVLIDSHGSV